MTHTDILQNQFPEHNGKCALPAQSTALDRPKLRTMNENSIKARMNSFTSWPWLYEDESVSFEKIYCYLPLKIKAIFSSFFMQIHLGHEKATFLLSILYQRGGLVYNFLVSIQPFYNPSTTKHVYYNSYSTVTLLARFRGLSTSQPRATAV